jgi:hypothetical protein
VLTIGLLQDRNNPSSASKRAKVSSIAQDFLKGFEFFTDLLHDTIKVTTDKFLL